MTSNAISNAAPGDQTQLTRLTQVCVDAVTQGNTLWLNARLRHDFVRSNADAGRWDRTTFLKNAAFSEGLTGLVLDDIRVRVFGESAIVHSRANFNTTDGKPSVGRYTHVWERNALTPGGWVCVAADVSRAVLS